MTLTDDKSNLAMTRKAIKSTNTNKYSTLMSAEVHALSHYIRRTLFRKIKFVNEPIMMDLLPEVFKKLDISDPDEQKKKTRDLMKCIKDTLSSRRGYTTQIVVNKLRGKFTLPTMSLMM